MGQDLRPQWVQQLGPKLTNILYQVWSAKAQLPLVLKWPGIVGSLDPKVFLPPGIPKIQPDYHQINQIKTLTDFINRDLGNMASGLPHTRGRESENVNTTIQPIIRNIRRKLGDVYATLDHAMSIELGEPQELIERLQLLNSQLDRDFVDIEQLIEKLLQVLEKWGRQNSKTW